MTTTAGERSAIMEHGPHMEGFGTSRMWMRTINGKTYSFTAVLMPNGERRYNARVLAGNGDARFDCNWKQAGFWTIPAPYWCETCGNEISNGKCSCWCFVADALQRYLGMDFDSSAELASRMWDQTDMADRTRVWTAEYADTHNVTTYPKPASN